MVKFLGSQLAFFLEQRESRANMRALALYVAFVAAVVGLCTVIFHWIMIYEGRDYSWLTGVYWVLTVMSTLGFGDITFESDLGRAFSIVVLLSGIILLLIVLPFAFIRFFFAPWIESRVHLRAPRRVGADIRGHVVFCRWDSMTADLAERLQAMTIPYVAIEPDAAVAGRMYGDGIQVVTGQIDDRETLEAAGVDRARLIFANCEDTTNANVAITVRQLAPKSTIAAVAENPASIDVLELAGADRVMPLKQRLGEHLANRVNAGYAHAHVIGRYQDLRIAEFAVHRTPFSGKTLQDTRLREATGVNVIGVWERGSFVRPTAELRLSDESVAVVIGTEAQITELDTVLVIYHANYNPVIVIGGGRVGRAAAAALRQREITVHLLDSDSSLRDELAAIADRVIIGDAAERSVLEDAGLNEAPSVILTTNDDATNIYLSIYCRRLNPELRIVSRVTHERNIEAIHRAGTDLALGYDALGVESVVSILQGREVAFLGEGAEIFILPVPESLASKSLGESHIGARTGLNVISVRSGDQTITNPLPSTQLDAGAQLVLLGTHEQSQIFLETFGTPS